MRRPSSLTSSGSQPKPCRSIRRRRCGCGSEKSQVPPASQLSPSRQENSPFEVAVRYELPRSCSSSWLAPPRSSRTIVVVDFVGMTAGGTTRTQRRLCQVHPEAVARDAPSPGQDRPLRSHATRIVNSAYTLHPIPAEIKTLTAISRDLGLDNAKRRCSVSARLNLISGNARRLGQRWSCPLWGVGECSEAAHAERRVRP